MRVEGQLPGLFPGVRDLLSGLRGRSPGLVHRRSGLAPERLQLLDGLVPGATGEGPGRGGRLRSAISGPAGAVPQLLRCSSPGAIAQVLHS